VEQQLMGHRLVRKGIGSGPGCHVQLAVVGAGSFFSGPATTSFTALQLYHGTCRVQAQAFCDFPKPLSLGAFDPQGGVRGFLWSPHVRLSPRWVNRHAVRCPLINNRKSEIESFLESSLESSPESSFES
jgi:hypothetical protein